MNILFFLTPKAELTYIYEDETVLQALEKIEVRRYTAIPVINRQGNYVGTLTEGDLLFCLKNQFSLNFTDADKIKISQVRRYRTNQPVYADADIEDLLQKAANQNFVPVIDDQDIFIGIVTRRDIIQHCIKKIRSS